MLASLSAISFAFPAALWALLALPLIWWLLRFTPPRPETVRFPPFRLLLDLANRDETANHTPWWLILLRLTLAALLILAVAAPYIDKGGLLTQGTGDRLIVLDDSWPAARDWPSRTRAVNDILDAAARDGVNATLALTTPSATPQDFTPQAPQALKARLTTLKPKALAPNRAALARALAQSFTANTRLHIIWLTDGVDDGTAAAFAQSLRALNNSNTALTLIESPLTPTGLAEVKLTETGLEARISAMPGTAREFRITATASNGRVLAEAPATLTANETTTTARLELPLELRNEAQAIRITGENTAGAVQLMDDRARRKRVGLLTGAGLEAAEPLLSPLYYVSRALEPYAELQASAPNIGALLDGGLSMLVLADVGRIPQEDTEKLTAFIEKGGVLLRFAGTRLAAATDSFAPVALREGGRGLGGTMGWEKPQSLAPFPQSSPFAGLTPDPRTQITRQVLAEPGSDLPAKTWASLADGTPLVTAEKRGKGLIILFHVTANNEWSNLPLSGLFVDMLRRILDLSPGLGSQAAPAEAATAAFAPLRALDGFGDLTPMPPEAAPIPASAIDKAAPSPQTPAGFYGKPGATRALNLKLPPELKPIPALAEATARGELGPQERQHLRGYALALALILFALDTIASLWITGGLTRLRGGAIALALLPLAFAPHESRAQEAAQTTTLAYVITGDSETDSASERGLEGLSRMLLERTAVEPGAPAGVNVESDELVFYPLLYWPVRADAPVLSPKASDKLSAYIRNGGMVFFDTRDAGEAVPGQATAQSEALQRILSRLDVPALEPVPEGHVLTKSFYLLKSFPGRFDAGKLWVEEQASSRADNVSSILIGSNDYAGAWAIDDIGNTMYPVSPGGDDQREMAYRVGINVVMYALTGNYKADQVHVPALLERLGQ